MPGRGTTTDRVPIGEVTGAHGVRGLLRVRSFNAASTLVAGLDPIELRDAAGSLERHAVTRAAPHGGGTWLVELADVGDRTAAEALVGRHVVVSPEMLPALEDDEFYHHEVVGFSVETTAGDPLGTVAATLSTGLNDVWVVRDGRRERLVPVIADVVDTIDRAGRRIVIVPMAGLLD